HLGPMFGGERDRRGAEARFAGDADTRALQRAAGRHPAVGVLVADQDAYCFCHGNLSRSPGYRTAASVPAPGAGGARKSIGSVSGASTFWASSPKPRSASVKLPPCAVSHSVCACSGVTASVTKLTLLSSSTGSPRVDS